MITKEQKERYERDIVALNRYRLLFFILAMIAFAVALVGFIIGGVEGNLGILISAFSLAGFGLVLFIIRTFVLNRKVIHRRERLKEEVVDKIETPKAEENVENADYIEKIRKLKELLDSGAITQEEYDSLKKKELDKIK